MFNYLVDTTATTPREHVKTGPELENIRKQTSLAFLCAVELHILSDKSSLNKRLASRWRHPYSRCLESPDCVIKARKCGFLCRLTSTSPSVEISGLPRTRVRVRDQASICISHVRLCQAECVWVVKYLCQFDAERCEAAVHLSAAVCAWRRDGAHVEVCLSKLRGQDLRAFSSQTHSLPPTFHLGGTLHNTKSLRHPSKKWNYALMLICRMTTFNDKTWMEAYCIQFSLILIF